MSDHRDLVPRDRPRDPAEQGRRGGSLSQRLKGLDRRDVDERAREQGLPELPPRGRDLAPSTAPSEIATTRELPPARQPRQARPVARSHHGRGDIEFHPRALEIDEAPLSPIRWWVLGAIAALFVAAFGWAYFGRLASYTAAAGKIQATGRTKVLEALAKGQAVKVQVRNGDIVKTGQVLVELDPTEAQAARTIVAQKLDDTKAEKFRRDLEIKGARAATIDTKPKIDWMKDVPSGVRRREESVAQADLAQLAAQLATLASQKRAKEAERDKYANSITAQNALIAVTKENMAMIEDLTKRGYNSQAKFLDFKATLDGQQVAETALEGSLENAKQTILTIDAQIAKTRETFVTTNTQTVSQLDQQIVDLTQQLVKADQKLGNMTLRAPVNGVVHALSVTTVGQVVKPGQQLMQIVPNDSKLEILAYVTNTDIGFIRVGDPATIKVNTFVYGTYGSIDGTVTDVAREALTTASKDSVQDASLDGEYASTTTAQKTGNIQFPVTIKAARGTMMIDGKEVPLTPGMGVSVEIETERRRAIDYIVSPIEELFSTAAHEK